MASHLSGGRVNLAILRESYRRELLECLDRCAGTKALVWDDALTGPFGLIAEYSLLKEHEVDKMFPLRPGRLPPSTVQNIVFICRPKLSLMEDVAKNVLREEESGGFRKDFHIFFVPRKSLLCERRLKELGVYGTFTNVDEYCLDMIPFENDLLSMEMEDSFKECYLENDNTSLYYVAKALMTLQALYGVMPNIHGKGVCARHVVDIMARMRREMAGSEIQITPQIDNLLILDRSADLITPLLSQLTYEGLLDEIFTIQNTSVKLPPEKFISSSSNTPGPQEVPNEAHKKFILNSGEDLYAELRDRNFNAVGPLLSKKAKMISAQFDERHAAKTVGEIKQFVSKLPHMQAAKQSLATHTSIAELIKEVTDSDSFMENLRAQQEFINAIDTDKANPYIEDCIAKEEPLIKVLRLVCLQSLCNNGFKQKVLDYYKREIIQTYGYEHMITLSNLEKAGFLKLQGQRTYPTIKKMLKLIVEDVNELVLDRVQCHDAIITNEINLFGLAMHESKTSVRRKQIYRVCYNPIMTLDEDQNIFLVTSNPNDISYVFSGFAPLSVRLAQILHRPGWRSISEVLSALPGPTVEEIQQIPIGLKKRRGSITSSHSGTGEQKVTLIVFLGGVTYAEIAALRFLSQQEDGPTEYIIATTKIINGNTWLKSISHTLSPKSTNPF